MRLPGMMVTTAPIAVQAQRRAGSRHVRLQRNHFGQRMADIGRRHTGAAVDRSSNGKITSMCETARCDLLDAAAAPGPDLRTDEMHGRNAGALQLLFQPEVESRDSRRR